MKGFCGVEINIAFCKQYFKFIISFLFNKKYILLMENNFEIDFANCVLMKLFKKMKH